MKRMVLASFWELRLMFPQLLPVGQSGLDAGPSLESKVFLDRESRFVPRCSRNVQAQPASFNTRLACTSLTQAQQPKSLPTVLSPGPLRISTSEL